MEGGAGAGPSCDASSGVPSALRVDGLAAPLDIEGAPRFGWQVSTSRQTAYEVRVASTRALAESAIGDVWSSGKVVSANQIDVLHAGPELALAQRYFWLVRTWNDSDEASCWSQVAAFGTGPGSSWQHSTPIWAPSSFEGWDDVTLRARLTIDEVALGLRFRSPDSSNGYMWQFRGDNRLVLHRLVDGGYSALETVDLPAGTLAIGKEVEVAIEALGATIRTFIDGTLVDTTTDATFAEGGIGVRTGSTESGSIAELSLVDAQSAALFAADFSGDGDFGCAKVNAGRLQVPQGASCLNRGSSVDWAFLRRDFLIADKPIAHATLYATATDPEPAKQYVYKASVNGSFVGLGPTQPIRDEARYDGFDVSEQLRAGANTLGVLAYTTRGQKFQAELWLTYADGSQETLGTDGSWQAQAGEGAFPAAGSIGTAVYAAPKEHVDARYFPYGFDTATFDATAFTAAREKPAIAELAAAAMAKVQQQLHAPAQIIQKAPGHYFIDFGRTWVGGIKYQVQNGSSGQKVEVRFGEVTSAANTVRYALSTGNNYQDVFTLDQGAQQFETWGMRVFRYVEILGAPEPITAENLQALALVYPFDQGAARLTASSPELESVWQLSKNTIEALNVNFYTDSWTRERIDYEADAYLQLLSSAYLSDDLSLGRYSMDYFEDHRTWPTEWPLYVILAVHDAWQQTGYTQQVRAYYEELKTKLPEAWLDEASHLVRKTTGSNDCGGTDCDIVDWPKSQRDGYQFRQYNTVVNALAYRAYRDMAAMATALGESTDATSYTQRADDLRQAINQYLYDQAGGRYDDGMDEDKALTGHYALHASAFALAFGVPEAAEMPRVASYVASRGMACSVYCAAFLLNGLYAAGSGQAALDLLTSSSKTSWLNMINAGVGATSEAWDISMKGNLSHSHPWAASPAFVVPSGLFGIQALEPGYAKFRVKPQPGDLERASITVPTVRGTVGVAFDQASGGAFLMAVQIPGNTSADLSIPADDATTVLYVNQQPRAVTVDSGYATLSDVGAGCQLVSTEPGADPQADELLASICAAAP